MDPDLAARIRTPERVSWHSSATFMGRTCVHQCQVSFEAAILTALWFM